MTVGDVDSLCANPLTHKISISKTIEYLLEKEGTEMRADKKSGISPTKRHEIADELRSLICPDEKDSVCNVDFQQFKPDLSFGSSFWKIVNGHDITNLLLMYNGSFTNAQLNQYMQHIYNKKEFEETQLYSALHETGLC